MYEKPLKTGAAVAVPSVKGRPEFEVSAAGGGRQAIA